MITCISDEVVRAAIFFLKELLPVDKIPDLDIEFYEMHTLKGWCSCDSDGEFELCLDSMMDHEIMLVTLAHECVHIKQYVLGELVDYPTPMWKSQLWPEDKLDDYDNLPWEREAYDLEIVLYDKYLKYK
jgi:hypothetical protein